MNDETLRVQQTLTSVNDLCGYIPEPFHRYAEFPTFLQDFYLNFRRFVWADGFLHPCDKAFLGLAVAIKMDCIDWVRVFENRIVSQNTGTYVFDEIRALVATAEMHNTYYKFFEMSGNASFATRPATLRAYSTTPRNVGENIGELIALVISNLNSCHICTSGHAAQLARRGVITDDAMLEAIQLASTIAAGCVFLRAQ